MGYISDFEEGQRSFVLSTIKLISQSHASVFLLPSTVYCLLSTSFVPRHANSLPHAIDFPPYLRQVTIYSPALLMQSLRPPNHASRKSTPHARRLDEN